MLQDSIKNRGTTLTTDDIERKILKDERNRNLRIIRDAGPRGWSFAILHPRRTADWIHNHHQEPR